VVKLRVEPQKERVPAFILRESRALLAIRLMTLFIIAISALLLVILISTMFGSLGLPLTATDVVSLNLIMFLTLTIVTTISAASIVLKWKSEYYKITEDGIIKLSGILKKREDRFACSFVEGMTVQQSVIGRFFDYGDIAIYDPSQQQKIYLMNIPNPNRTGVRIGQVVKKSDEKSIPLMPATDHEAV